MYKYKLARICLIGLAKVIVVPSLFQSQAGVGVTEHVPLREIVALTEYKSASRKS